VTLKDQEFLQEGKQLEILKDIAEALNETTDISQAMEAILPRLSGVLGLSTAWAFRFDPKRGSFVEVGASGLPPALACDDAAPLKTGWCECQDQFVSGKLDTAVNIVRCSRLRDAVGDKAGLTYHASVPLRSKGKPLGILNVAAAGHSVFTKPALDLLTAIGHHVAVAVDRAGILADERHRANQLKAMSGMAAELVSFVQPAAILEYAVQQFVEALGYECCGITVGTTAGAPEEKPRLVAAAYRPVHERSTEYSYLDSEDMPLLPEAERILLPEARSVLVRPIPHSEYEIRLESCLPNAFRDVDEDVVSAFAWHVAAALENARLYEKSLDEAKWVERRRLAADLHDAVSQRLFSALLLARTVKMLAERERDYGEIGEAALRVERLIAESQQEMRDLIEALRPQEERGLVSLIRERVAPLQLQTQTRIHLTAESDGDVCVTFEQREALLKVVDEALQNTFKHAKAKNVYVRVAHDADRLVVSIQDDGIGFRETEVQPGLGTSTMYERIQRIGGTLYIVSQPNGGTRVTCEIPLAAGKRRTGAAEDSEEVEGV
jgi:signal transduction histidine kinase